MNFINRAVKNVTRKMSKTVLLVLTFFLIGNLVIIGLGVSNASESAKTLTRQKMRAVVTYSLDYQAVWQYADSLDDDAQEEFYKNYPRVKLEDVYSLLEDERVKMANSISSSQAYSETLDYVHLNNEAEQRDAGNNTSCYYDFETGEEVCETWRNPSFFIKTNMFAGMIEFEDGDYQIVDGRFYSKEDIDNHAMVCLITQSLAEQNGLKVGDTITISNDYLSAYNKKYGITQEDLDTEYEIIGLYTHNSPILPGSSQFDYCYPYENPDNMILMPTTSQYMGQLKLRQKQFDAYIAEWPDEADYYRENYPTEENMLSNIYMDSVTLLLNDPLEVDEFVDDASKNLKQFMKLDANNEQFNNLAKPLDTLSMYANFIVWLVVINAIVIITLVTALTLKTREYEIGVLLSLGATKLKVVGQFFIELALVAIIGFTLSVGSGSLIAKRIGNTVLEYQLAANSEEDTDDSYYYGDDYIDIWNQDYTTEITLEDLIAEYEVSISPIIIGEIYLLGLGIVAISVVIPSFMIMRFNPKMILMNRG